MGRHHHYSAYGPPAPRAGSHPGERTVIPAPANDNGRPSTARIAVVAIAVLVALAMAVLALQPFG